MKLKIIYKCTKKVLEQNSNTFYNINIPKIKPKIAKSVTAV